MPPYQYWGRLADVLRSMKGKHVTVWGNWTLVVEYHYPFFTNQPSPSWQHNQLCLRDKVYFDFELMKLRDKCNSMFIRHLHSHHGGSTPTAYEFSSISVYPLMMLVIALLISWGTLLITFHSKGSNKASSSSLVERADWITSYGYK